MDFLKTLFLPSTLICFQLWALQFTLQSLHVATPAIITLRDQSQFFNCGYVVPPLNAQYEEVQPDLHSLERYDFSKMPDLPWYP